MKTSSSWSSLLALSLACGLAEPLLAQTNTFPDSGNVGIGTMSPGHGVLDVYQSAARSNAAMIEVNNADTGVGYDYGIWLKNRNATPGNFTSIMNWDSAMNGNAWIEFINVDHSTPKGQLAFITRNGAVYSRRMLIDENGNVGIGTAAPAARLDVAGDIRSTGNLVEKKTVFTPSGVGWYRIATGSWSCGGTIRISGIYDNGATSQEISFTIRGYGQGGGLTLTRIAGVNGGVVDYARISTNGAAGLYLDLHVGTATAPRPITVFGYGPDMPALEPNPVVGAVSGSTDVRVLPVYGDFGDGTLRTTMNFATWSRDGSSPQGYIYHGPSGQAAFGNGVVNGETWITRTGGAGCIKFGDYDFGTALMTLASTGNVGIGTTNPTNKLEVNGTIRTKEVIVETTGWSDYVFASDYRLAPLSEVEAHIQAKGTLPGIPSAAEVAEHGVSVGDMQAKLLAKIEELTLRQIAQEKRIDAQAAENAALKAEIAALRAK